MRLLPSLWTDSFERCSSGVGRRYAEGCTLAGTCQRKALTLGQLILAGDDVMNLLMPVSLEALGDVFWGRAL